MKNPFKRTPRNVLTFGDWVADNAALDRIREADQKLIAQNKLPPGAFRRCNSLHKPESVDQYLARTGWRRLEDGSWTQG